MHLYISTEFVYREGSSLNKHNDFSSKTRKLDRPCVLTQHKRWTVTVIQKMATGPQTRNTKQYTKRSQNSVRAHLNHTISP